MPNHAEYVKARVLITIFVNCGTPVTIVPAQNMNHLHDVDTQQSHTMSLLRIVYVPGGYKLEISLTLTINWEASHDNNAKKDVVKAKTVMDLYGGKISSAVHM